MGELWASIPSPFKELLLLSLGSGLAQIWRLIGQWLSVRNPKIAAIEGRLEAMEQLIHFAIAQGGALADSSMAWGTALVSLIQEIRRRIKAGEELEKLEEMARMAKNQLDIFYRESSTPKACKDPIPGKAEG